MSSTTLFVRYVLGYGGVLTLALVGVALGTTIPLGNLAFGVSLFAAAPALFVLGGFDNSVHAAEDAGSIGASPGRAMEHTEDTDVSDFPRAALAALVLGSAAAGTWALTFAGVA
ncbi:hypothetical protein [Halomarina oriensis]|uniref:Uncharacterized protein n=1 Tax=Halomarina oriensis TaxID=671145 RepID=A0A6B0GHB4_9EURY|nr:hypothetical protein [Halomarina oriensis]MWG34246.1 hypothetical protein [Halomarina oriensis]